MYAVTLTEKAIGHFSSVAKNKLVKFGIEGGGCSGFQYVWEVFDSYQPHMDGDEVQDHGDFMLYVDSHSIMYLIGSTIDYLSDITGSKIDIDNPNAKAGC